MSYLPLRGKKQEAVNFGPHWDPVLVIRQFLPMAESITIERVVSRDAFNLRVVLHGREFFTTLDALELVSDPYTTLGSIAALVTWHDSMESGETG